MRVPVTVTPSARKDIHQGARYFGGIRARLGVDFVYQILATLDRISDMPFGYGEVVKGVRAAGIRRFQYVVYYRCHVLAAEVVAVLHSGQSPKRWQFRT